MFVTQVHVTFQQADPAGIMFFGNIFYLTHSVKEKLVTEYLGIPWDNWFKASEYAAPIRHCESQFFKPLLPGQTYKVEVIAKNIGQSSYSLLYRFSQNETLHAEVMVTNVFITIKDKKKIDIPSDIRAKLEKLLPNA